MVVVVMMMVMMMMVIMIGKIMVLGAGPMGWLSGSFGPCCGRFLPSSWG